MYANSAWRLAWLIARLQTSAIAGAGNAQQASQNAKAAQVQLTAEDLQAIHMIGQQVTDSLDNNPVMWNWDS